MNDRPLPIVDTHSGLIIPGAAELIWGVMHYPNDIISAYSFHDLARGWLHTLESDDEATEPRVLRMIFDDFSRRDGRAKVSALVLHTFIRIFIFNGSASLRRAYAHVADVMGKEPINGKKKGDAPSGERAIRRAYCEEFCSVAHFWLAHIITSHDSNGLFDSSRGLNRFLGVAREIQEAATEAHLPVIDGRWIVPQSRSFDTSVRMRFHTGYDEEISSFLAGYSTAEQRDL